MKLLYSKHRGYVAIIFLFSAMIFIIPLLAVTFNQTMKFNDLGSVLIPPQREKAAVSAAFDKSVEYLTESGIIFHYLSVSVNPGWSAELLVREVDETIDGYALTTEIYYMNYVISDDTHVFDALKFPPSQKTVAGEQHFLVKTTLPKNEAPSRCEETAVEITVTGDVNVLWHREYVIY
ncbi:MAG: hypothetical protein FWG09_02695 [Synergistaceae bacterium]|nr:hypothetical protein [Synergistaceae bacterium]